MQYLLHCHYTWPCTVLITHLCYVPLLIHQNHTHGSEAYSINIMHLRHAHRLNDFTSLPDGRYLLNMVFWNCYQVFLADLFTFMWTFNLTHFRKLSTCTAKSNAIPMRVVLPGTQTRSLVSTSLSIDLDMNRLEDNMASSCSAFLVLLNLVDVQIRDREYVCFVPLTRAPRIIHVARLYRIRGSGLIPVKTERDRSCRWKVPILSICVGRFHWVACVGRFHWIASQSCRLARMHLFNKKDKNKINIMLVEK